MNSPSSFSSNLLKTAADHETGPCRPESASGSSHRLTAIQTRCLLKVCPSLKATYFNSDLICIDLFRGTIAHV